LVQAYLKACAEVGFAFTADFNGSQPEGVGIYQITTRNGFRDSTATAMLRPALKRRNLRLLLDAQVLRLDLDGHRAVGVQYRRGNDTSSARAGKAVVLCAGAVNSPQLLQLSGIGPGPLLQGLGIPVIRDVPAVGRNLQDHLGVNYYYRSRVPTLNNRLYPWWGKLAAGLQYALTRGGPLSMSVNQGGGFIKSDPALRTPDLQLYFNPASYTHTRTRTRRLMNPDPFPGFLLSFNSCRPTSRGHIELRSRDPLQAPAIYPNYLSTDRDLHDVVAGARLMRRIAAAKPLVSLIDHEMAPGPGKTSDAELLQDFRERAGSVFHAVGTCMMGPTEAEAVVDARLRVHGISNLRVIDASIFPTVTSGNTNGPTVMVADKGASMLLADAE
ncbi:MAG: GMC family oxidoreductase, partial [Steroidobacteraceae bacterium]